jgi:hypothetical protein
MSISLISVAVRHERRVRLVFSTSLALGAFIDTSLYAISSVGDVNAAPPVVAVFALANSPNVAELQLGADLVAGGRYTVSAVGVPAAAGTNTDITPPGTEHDFVIGRPTRVPHTRDATRLERVLYGSDLLFSGGDFQEDATGDLAERAGVALLEVDLYARMLSNGLPWAPEYGLHARAAVDAPELAMATLRGRAESQAREDDRVAEATARVQVADPDEDFDVANATVRVTITPIGESTLAARPLVVVAPLGA